MISGVSSSILVEVDLPKKKEYLVYAPMTSKQKELYDAALAGLSGLRDMLIEQQREKLGEIPAEAKAKEKSVEPEQPINQDETDESGNRMPSPSYFFFKSYFFV